MKKQKLILVDGHALIHRAFHALPPLTTKDGELVNAVYGFTSIFLKSLRDIKPDYIAVTFDKGKKTFRNKIYKEYKATRESAPPELYDQVPKIKKIMELFKVPIFELDDYEADDLIGTICKTPEVDNPEIDTIIVSGDLDLLQLVNENTKMYGLKRGLSDTIIYDIKNVKAKYDGLGPEQIVDYKALKGDASDNIPGVKGVGDKTAIVLLNEFKTLDGVYKNIDSDKIKESVRQKLINDKEKAYLSQELATIVYDAPIKFNLENAKVKPYDKEGLIDLFQEYQFRSLLNRLPDTDSTDMNAGKNSTETSNEKKIVDKTEYKLIENNKDFESFIKKLNNQNLFTFDTEATGLDPLTAILLGISFSWQKGVAYYIPTAQIKGEGLFEDIQINQKYLDKLKPIFENSKIKKIAHNFKYDAEIMLNHGIDPQNIYFDTMIASYLLNSGTRGHSLDNQAFVELGHQMLSYKELTNNGKTPLSQVPLAKVSDYSCEDADYTHRLYEKFEPKLAKEKLDKLFYEIEMPLVPVLIEMENNGIKVDAKFLATFSKKITKQIDSISNKIYKLAGSEFNISSPTQLKEILFEKLEISTKGISKTKTGFSTAADELDKLRSEHKIINFISEYRELTKLKSTYVDALPKLINQKTGRVHTSFNQTITATGRLSSSEPNLQNIPIRTELGRQVRNAFVAEKGNKLISADYSQIELRIVAHLSNDKNLIEAFQKGQDIHSATAAIIHGVKLEDVTPKLRSSAKEINFGIMYGMGANGVAQRTGMSRNDAKEFIEKYFNNFPAIKKFIQKTKDQVKDKGYVETMFNRKRQLPDIHSGVPYIAAAAERMAVNMPIQGAAADLIKMAMIDIFKKLEDISPQAKLILQVHDELIFEVPEEDTQKVTDFVQKEMENIYKFKCPLKVDIAIGNNWGELK